MSKIAENVARSEAVAAGCGEPVMPSAENHTLSLGVVAGMFKVSPLTLRLFELRGLIRRQRVGHEWVYSWSDCERIALLLKARKAGLGAGALQAVIAAMDEETDEPVADRGRQQCLALIHALEARQQAVGNVLAELYRIDWELSERLGVAQAGGQREAGKRD